MTLTVQSLKESKTRSAVIYLNEDGTLAITPKAQYDEVEAKRTIHPLEGRKVVGVVTFPYDETTMKWGGLYRADEKLEGRLPCREIAEDGNTIIEIYPVFDKVEPEAETA